MTPGTAGLSQGAGHQIQDQSRLGRGGLRQLKPTLDASTRGAADPCLFLLGELDLGGEQVPCFLARGLSGLKRLRKAESPSTCVKDRLELA